jgi:hypothetical protein
MFVVLSEAQELFIPAIVPSLVLSNEEEIQMKSAEQCRAE